MDIGEVKTVKDAERMAVTLFGGNATAKIELMAFGRMYHVYDGQGLHVSSTESWEDAFVAMLLRIN